MLDGIAFRFFIYCHHINVCRKQLLEGLKTLLMAFTGPANYKIFEQTWSLDVGGDRR
jgi:hypothetical protein